MRKRKKERKKEREGERTIEIEKITYELKVDERKKKKTPKRK